MVLTTDSPISIKGMRDGLLVAVGDGAYDEIINSLTTELVEKQGFLQGSQIVLQVGQRPLTQSRLADILNLFNEHGLTLWTVLAERKETRDAARELGLATRLAGSQTDLDGNAVSQAPIAASDAPQKATSALLLQETIRSGRSVYHEGHVVIIGDVNPGAEITAEGNVVVWGRLRGLVHAGAFGDETAVICALDLNPTQLRIADKIAIPPQENGRKPMPEQAAVRDDQIIAEPWTT